MECACFGGITADNPPMNEVVGLFIAQRVEPEFVPPAEFLSWAATDLKGSDRRNLGNALGNIKRALHGKIDELVGRTRVQKCHDWKNWNTPADDKLEVLKSLGIEHRAVLKLITESRNDFEHTYLLPSLAEVQAYLDVATMWLEKVDADYDFCPASFIGLPLLGHSSGSVDKTGSSLTGCRFDPKAIGTVQYFDDEDLVVIDTAGAQTRTPFKNYKWRDILRLDAPTFKSKSSYTALNRAASAHLLRLYLAWLKNPVTGFIEIQRTTT